VRVKLGGVIVPSTHILARSGLSSPLSERFEKHVFIECKKEGMVDVKLLAHGAFQEFNVTISKLIECRNDCNFGSSQAACACPL
jgi:hypothetical protein